MARYQNALRYLDDMKASDTISIKKNDIIKHLMRVIDYSSIVEEFGSEFKLGIITSSMYDDVIFDGFAQFKDEIFLGDRLMIVPSRDDIRRFITSNMEFFDSMKVICVDFEDNDPVVSTIIDISPYILDDVIIDELIDRVKLCARYINALITMIRTFYDVDDGNSRIVMGKFMMCEFEPRVVVKSVIDVAGLTARYHFGFNEDAISDRIETLNLLIMKESIDENDLNTIMGLFLTIVEDLLYLLPSTGVINYAVGRIIRDNDIDAFTSASVIKGRVNSLDKIFDSQIFTYDIDGYGTNSSLTDYSAHSIIGDFGDISSDIMCRAICELLLK